MRKSSFSPVLPYIVALALVVAATLLTHRFRSRIEEAAIFLPVFAAIVIGAWYGGLGPGLLATVASALLCECFLFEPYRSFSATATPPRLGLFLLVGGLIAALASARRRAAAVEQERRRWDDGILAAIIAERRRSEESKARLAALVETSNDAIIIWTLEGRVASWNPGAERMYGYSEPEALGQPSCLLVPPEREDVFRDVLSRIEQGERLEHFETVRWRKDGSRVEVSVTMSPVRGADGAPLQPLSRPSIVSCRRR